MKTFYSLKQKKYSGKELSSLFAYKNFGIQGNSLVAFCGPCEVLLEDLVDQEDVRKKAFIRSEQMVHFIAERFVLDLEEGIWRQRLYMVLLKETLEGLKPGIKISRRGDDLFINGGKLSVSIATLSPVSTLIHIGVNISSRHTPVKTIGLADLKIDYKKFIKMFFSAVQAEEESIRMARCKVKGVN